MNILLLGSGGREHAIAWKIAQSKKCTQLYIAPGNAGTKNCGVNIDLKLNDFESIASFVKSHQIEMVVVGPEEPLVNGVIDFLQQHRHNSKVLLVGPSKAGALLEGSKEFAKRFMIRHHIPTAAYNSFTAQSIDEGIAFLKSLKPPFVLKADGLAAGKGVLILNDLDEAISELNNMLINKAFGKASETVVIEKFLSGIELSVFVATDGNNWIMLPEAKDYKRIGEGDTGPNTGGMGAVSPVPFADASFMDKVIKQIAEPTVKGLQKENIPYKGFIFIGLMNCNGDPYVIEYNVRMGDPETEVVFPRIESDVVELFEKIALEKLNEYKLKISPEIACTVVMVSGGYPGPFLKGYEITGVDKIENSIAFYAGAVIQNEKTVTSGGRVLAITTLAPTLSEARLTSLKAASTISFANKYYRNDIGLDL